MPMNLRLLVPRSTKRGLLDLVPGAAAAYSLRSLSRSYAGPVVKVRRSSDDAEKDFTASQIDNGTLTTWVNATPDLPLDQSSGAAAAYSLRNLSSSYSGNVIRARRASDNDERDFTANEIIDGTLTTWTNASVALPLDEASGAAAAYSLRNLRANYTGDVIKVRRSSDNDELDFSASEITDGTLESWVGGQNEVFPSVSQSASDFANGIIFGLNMYPNVTTGVSDPFGGTDAVSIEWPDSSPRRYGTNVSGTNGLHPAIDGAVTASFWARVPSGTFSLSSYLRSTITPNVYSQNNTITTEWQRFTVTSTRSASNGPTGFYFSEDTPATVEIYGLQLETGSTASDLAITTSGPSGYGYVSTWYDQSGNDHHLPPVAAEGRIVAGGSVITEGGRPAIEFEGSRKVAYQTTIPASEYLSTVSFVAKSNVAQYTVDSGSARLANFTFQGPDYRFYFGTGTGYNYGHIGARIGNTQTLNVTPHGTQQFLLSALAKVNLTRVWFNGIQKVQTDPFEGSSALAEQIVTVGQPNQSETGWDGSFSEVIVYQSDITSQLTAIEANLAEFYGIDLPAGVDTANNEVDAFVTTWYDQSGNGNHATQTTATYQPKIVSAGALVTENGKAAIEFDGTDDRLVATGYSPSGTISAFALFTFSSLANVSYTFASRKYTTPSGGFTLFNYPLVNPDRIALQTGLGGTWVDGVNNINIGVFDLIQSLIYLQITTSGTELYLRDSLLLSDPAGEIAVGSNLMIGADPAIASSYPFDGTFQELIIYPSDQSDYRQGIETNTALHYNIFTTMKYKVQSNEVDGYVATWYDQSGNGYDAAQTTADYQPKLVSAGALITDGDEPAIEFDGTSDKLTISDSTVLDLPATVFIVLTHSSSTAAERYIFGRQLSASNGGIIIRQQNVTERVELSSIDAASPYPSVNFLRKSGQDVVVAVASPPNTSIYSSFVLEDTDSSMSGFANASHPVVIGARPDAAAYYWDSKIQEIIVYPFDQSSQRQRIEGNLAWKYNIEDKLPWDHPYARSFPSFGSQRVPTDSDAIAYLTAVSAADGVGVEVPIANAIEDFIVGCKADGIWDSIKASCILAGARSLEGALVPLAGPDPIEDNFINADYSRFAGLTGRPAGFTRIRTQFSPTDLDDFNNSSHISVYATNISSAVQMAYIGLYDFGNTGTDANIVSASYGVNTSKFKIGGSNIVIDKGYTGGFAGANRTAVNSFFAYSNGSASAPRTNNIGSLVPQNRFYIFANNANAVTQFYSDATIAFYSIGDQIDLQLLDTRISNLIASINLYLDIGLNPDNYDQDTINYIYNAYKAGGSLA